MAERDESVGNLEAFLAETRQARQALGAAQAALDARNDGLTSETTAHAGRLHAIAQGLTALLESFQALHGETQGTLAALGHASSRLAEERLGGLRGALGDTRTRFVTGQAHARELLEAADGEWEHEFTESQTSLDALDAQAGDLETESDHVFSELQTRIAATDASLRETVNHVAMVVDASADYVSQGLEHFLAGAFTSLDAHVEREATPFVVDAFADLTRSLTRSFDEYDAVVDSASQDLEQTTEPLLAQAARGTEELHRRTQAHLDRCGRDGLDPLDEETGQSLGAMTRGETIAANLPPLLPQLATARDVAERVQELMDAFNPFG